MTFFEYYFSEADDFIKKFYKKSQDRSMISPKARRGSQKDPNLTGRSSFSDTLVKSLKGGSDDESGALYKASKMGFKDLKKKASKKPKEGSWGYVDISEPMFILLQDKWGDGAQCFKTFKNKCTTKGKLTREPYSNKWGGKGYKYIIDGKDVVYLFIDEEGFGQVVFENPSAVATAQKIGMIGDAKLLADLGWLSIDPDMMHKA